MRSRHRLTRGAAAAILMIATTAGLALAAANSPEGDAAQPRAHHVQVVQEPAYGSSDQTAIALGKIAVAAQYVTVQAEVYATEYNRQQVAAWVAAHTPRPVVHSGTIHSTPSYSGGGGPVGACGGATNGADRFIHRESGGDPTILNGGAHASSPYNGSGRAFGCYQIMPGTWSGSCSDITTYDPASQARCASRLPQSAWGG